MPHKSKANPNLAVVLVYDLKIDREGIAIIHENHDISKILALQAMPRENTMQLKYTIPILLNQVTKKNPLITYQNQIVSTILLVHNPCLHFGHGKNRV